MQGWLDMDATNVFWWGLFWMLFALCGAIYVGFRQLNTSRAPFVDDGILSSNSIEPLDICIQADGQGFPIPQRATDPLPVHHKSETRFKTLAFFRILPSGFPI